MQTPAPTYHIFTDATADLSPHLLYDLPPLGIVPMPVEIGGMEYDYGSDSPLTIAGFYAAQRQGQFASTSQISPATYCRCFEAALRQEQDVLYLCLTSGLSGTLNAARLAAEQLQQKYPQRRIICLDTLCASVGLGLLVREALLQQQAGAELTELAEWVEERKYSICHWFTVDEFTHLHHGGRVSATAAAAGTILNIKPLLHVDMDGRLEVAAKLHGRRRAMAMQLDKMAEGWLPEMGQTVLIGHGDDLAAALQLQDAVQSRFPEARPLISEIGPVIGAHTGPNMLALIYWGCNR